MKAVLALLVAMGASSAFAAIPDTLNLTCNEAMKLVKRNGVINMTSGTDKYVRYTADSNGSWCFSDEDAITAWVPTLDGNHCPVGYVCVDDNYNGSLTSDND